MTRILVTGATGYIGRNLVSYLAELADIEIHIIVRPHSNDVNFPSDKITKHVYDGTFASLAAIFSTVPIDVVIHFAALATYDTSADNINTMTDANIKFGTFLLEAMHLGKCHRLINTGTYWQHYQGEEYNPVSLYAAMKQAFESLIEYYVQAQQFSVFTLKLMDIYGPNDSRKKLFQLIKEAASLDKPLAMTAGEQYINLLYIDDVINAYITAMKSLLATDNCGFHKKYFVAAKESLPLRKVVELYLENTQYSVKIDWGKRKYRVREVMRPHIGEILPGWQPAIDLQTGIQEIVNSYQEAINESV